MTPSAAGVSALVLCVAVIAGCTSLSRTDPPAYAVIDRVTIGGSGGWDYVSLDPSGARLFISRGDRVQVWSTSERKVVGEVPDTPGVHGVAFARELGRGFTSNGRGNSVTVFRLDDLKIEKTIAIAAQNPDAILYEPRVQRVYTFNGRSHDATAIDARTLAPLANIALGGKPEGGVSDGAGRIFVNIEDTAEIAVIDAQSNKVVARWPLAPCTNPTGLALDAAHMRLFSTCQDNRMVVTDAASGRRVATLAIGGGPDAAEFDPALGLAFSSNGEGTLTVVREDDPEHFHVVADVATQPRARTMALDPSSHRVYLVTASFGEKPAPTAAQPNPRPAMLPDTFTVLVAAPR